ncbi:hypothetical protein MIND_00449000 [Mycena indigotica]|uniref:F-box domain-containing protein n=1 Tax=Mycena indigotica TaxID=2126181 RepID=A0A8H6SXF0_9AGAR|nr:uncharacterized protein MIND_00449000 [Mycena indigotica]KAF7306577.1 hypothetical protein MIND_00449000 [Mycena indigotica]
MASLLQLPNEVIEHIICQVAYIHPTSVAAVSASNHRLHELVHSNWRAIYLSLFDDPRTKSVTLSETPLQPRKATSRSNWTSFTQRIAAANALSADNSDCDFQSLIETLKDTPAVSYEQELEAAHCERAVVFPPLLRRRNVADSKNITWLQQIISPNGYPSQLIGRYLRPLDPDGEPASRPEFEDGVQGQAFNKLVFLRGFMPDTSDDAPDLEEQHILSRALARTRVYNTKYLMGERMWGPFQPLDPRKHEAYSWRTRLHRTTKEEDEAGNLLLRSASTSRFLDPSSIILAHAMNMDMDSDSDDPDYRPENDADQDDGDSDDSNDEDDPNTQGLLLQFLAQHGINLAADEESHPTYVFPAPHRVIPDYAFLAAARIVLEARLRDIFNINQRNLFLAEQFDTMRLAARDVNCELEDIVEAMQSLNMVRMGGAPGFWQAWRPKVEEDVSIKDTGKEKETEYKGWDWAGVAGEWRRVVCWLDYRDLLVHNVNIPALTFKRNEVSETTRIFPMTLRIARYERPPRPPHGANPDDLIWRLPIIHVEGESRGTDTNVDLRRVIEGTVRMIGDGAVRWSMTSGEPSADRPEWVTESVQVGELGSAMGIIGLWTGAEHSQTEPIGPCWAWKISS